MICFCTLIERFRNVLCAMHNVSLSFSPSNTLVFIWTDNPDYLRGLVELWHDGIFICCQIPLIFGLTSNLRVSGINVHCYFFLGIVMIEPQTNCSLLVYHVHIALIWHLNLTLARFEI